MRFTIILAFAAGIAAAGVIGLLTSSGGGPERAIAGPPSPVVQANIINTTPVPVVVKNATPVPVSGSVHVNNSASEPANVVVRNATPVPVIGEVIVDTQPGDPMESVAAILNQGYAQPGVTLAAGATETLVFPSIMAVSLVSLESEQKVRARLVNTAGDVIPIVAVDDGTDVAPLTQRVLAQSMIVTCYEVVDPCFYAVFAGGRIEP